LLELCQLDAGSQIDLVQDRLEFGFSKAFPPLGDGERQAIERRARNTPRQQAVANLIKQRQKLLAMINASGSAVGGVLDALKSQDGIDGGDRTASGQGGGRVCVPPHLCPQPNSLAIRGTPPPRNR
jgi:hypothetical protein